MNSTRRNAIMMSAASLAVWAGCATVAFAGQTDAAACAARLTPQGQVIFRAVADHVKPDSDIPALLRAYVRPLVMGGHLTRDEAMQNAQPAGKCLLLLK